MTSNFDIREHFKKITVLDKGHVELMDGMVTDPMLKIVNAARVSFNKEAIDLTERDKKLIKFLIEHEHFSTVRHSYFSFRIKAPLSVFRQWWKYQIGSDWIENENIGSIQIPDTSWNEACLTGDTLIYCNDHKDNLIKMQIKDLFDKWNNNKQGKVKELKVRSMNEQNNMLTTNKIIDVIDRGMQDVFKVTLKDGKRINLTKNHRVYTDDGWKTMGESLSPILLNNNSVAFNKNVKWATNGIPVAGNGLYKNKEWLAEKLDNNLNYSEIALESECSEHTIRKWVKRYGLKGKNCNFKKGDAPWNKNKSYKIKDFAGYSKEHIEAIKLARSGEKSNFWKGGISSDRRNITRWTTENAQKVHKKHYYTCQQCGEQNNKLHAHHIKPVYFAPNEAYDINNLISVCIPCHRKIHKTIETELSFMEQFCNVEKYDVELIKKAQYEKKSISIKNSLKMVKYTEVVSVEYLGQQQCYDLEMEAPNKNFVANGIIVHNSGRYVEFEPEFYIPESIRVQSKDNKQGSFGKLETEIETGLSPVEFFEQSCLRQYEDYKKLVEAGAAKEQARMLLPQNIYSECIWTCSLQTILFFLHQRLKEDAQWEIREYAKGILELTRPILIDGLVK